MATNRRAPGKLAARISQARSFSNEMKDKAKQEARDFSMSYRDAVSGPKLDAGYKKSARIARRAERKASKGKVADFRGQSIDMSRRKKAISQISEGLNTAATGKARKKIATTYYKATKERAKIAANPKYAARVSEKKRSLAQQANPISSAPKGRLSAAQQQRVCPQGGGCAPGGKKSMKKR